MGRGLYQLIDNDRLWSTARPLWSRVDERPLRRRELVHAAEVVRKVAASAGERLARPHAKALIQAASGARYGSGVPISYPIRVQGDATSCTPRTLKTPVLFAERCIRLQRADGFTGLENRQGASPRGFESHPLRSVPPPWDSVPTSPRLPATHPFALPMLVTTTVAGVTDAGPPCSEEFRCHRTPTGCRDRPGRKLISCVARRRLSSGYAGSRWRRGR